MKYYASEVGGIDKIESIQHISCKEYLAHIESKIDDEIRKRAAQNNI